MRVCPAPPLARKGVIVPSDVKVQSAPKEAVPAGAPSGPSQRRRELTSSPWDDSRVSKAFTKDDRADEPVVVRHRSPLPDGVPNYVTPRGLQALRAELAAVEPGARRSELERRIAAAVPAPPPADRDEIRFGAHVRLRDRNGDIRQVQIVGVDEASPAEGWSRSWRRWPVPCSDVGSATR